MPIGDRNRTRERDDELHRARVHMLFVCRMYKFCSTMKVGTSCMNTAKVSCHGEKIASKNFMR